MAKKKKAEKEQGSYTDFPVMLHVDSEGVAYWANGAKDHFEALNNCSQSKNYSMQANREQEMRRQFDELTTIVAEKKEKERLNPIRLEEKYGERARVMARNGETVKEIVKALGISRKEVRILTREV